MPDWNRVAPQHVLTALAEYDRVGDKEFVRRVGFGRSKAHTLWHRGNEYDVRAVAGAAYLHATGQPPQRADVAGDEAGAAKVLRDLGFDIAVDELAVEQLQQQRRPPVPKAVAKPARKTAAKQPARKAAAAPKPVSVCPRCYTALPASGQCDYCD